MSTNRFYGDTGGPEYDPWEDVVRLRDGEAILPHSCDSWTIGGKKQVLRMIKDLRAILKDPAIIEDSVAIGKEPR